MSGRPKVVALGGGHGLAASLSALRLITDQLTAIVTVADDGGSSGRLRRELGVMPPGDLRMALSALCDDNEWGHTWRDLLQHRFESAGELHNHAVGNLLIVALWELLGDTVAGLDWVARLLGARGRVLPMAAVPLDIQASVVDTGREARGEVHTVRGQVAVASAGGRVIGIQLVPPRPPACPEAVGAIESADWVVLGPGSWFTSVLPHLLVPDLCEALENTQARRVVALNLTAQAGETEGFSAETHLEVLAAHAPNLTVDVVLADHRVVDRPDSLRDMAEAMGGRLVVADLADPDDVVRHDAFRLAAAFRDVFE